MNAFLTSLIAGLIPEKIKAVASSIVDKAQALLQGEPALVVGNGAAVIIYLVAKASGSIPDVTFEVALAQGVAGIATLNIVLVTIRQLVTPVAK